jgi:hypothetical protein
LAMQCLIWCHFEREGFPPRLRPLRLQLCLSQLTLDSFTLKDLQEWLQVGISAGSVVLIVQCTKQDIDDIKADYLTFPYLWELNVPISH